MASFPLIPGQTRMRVDESSNSHSSLAWNSHALSSTLLRSHRLWTCLNFSWESMRVWRTLVLVWPELMIVDESWWKLSWESTLINSHPRLARAFKCNRRVINIQLLLPIPIYFKQIGDENIHNDYNGHSVLMSGLTFNWKIYANPLDISN